MKIYLKSFTENTKISKNQGREIKIGFHGLFTQKAPPTVGLKYCYTLYILKYILKFGSVKLFKINKFCLGKHIVNFITGHKGLMSRYGFIKIHLLQAVHQLSVFVAVVNRAYWQ